MRSKELFEFMYERHNIWIHRSKGRAKPWTKDPILQQNRFCNVYRELDKVTMWIAKNWRAPHQKDPHLWFAMVVARLFNLPSTLELFGYPVPFEPRQLKKMTMVADARHGKIFNGAYIVSTNGRKMNKVDYLIEQVLVPLWAERDAVRDVVKLGTLQDVHTKLMQFQGLGSFMAAQVVCDLKYVRPLSAADDWHTWAASGPGSRRGLNRVCNRSIDAVWTEQGWLAQLTDLKRDIDLLTYRRKMPDVHAQDLQNCLCEFDKYERVRLREGTTKQKYPGT